MDCYGGLAAMSGYRRDILKHPAVVSGSPTCTLLQGTLLLIIFVGALPTIKTEDLRLKIMRGLHIARTPQLSQVRIFDAIPCFVLLFFSCCPELSAPLVRADSISGLPCVKQFSTGHGRFAFRTGIPAE